MEKVELCLKMLILYTFNLRAFCGSCVWGKHNAEESEEQNDVDKNQIKQNQNNVVRLYLYVLRRHMSGSRLQLERMDCGIRQGLELKLGSDLHTQTSCGTLSHTTL